MSTQIFKEYQPGTSSYAQRITIEDWDKHRSTVANLHNQHATKKTILAELNRCGFYPSMGQLVAQMKKWNLTVYGFRAVGVAERVVDDKLPQCEVSALDSSMAITDNTVYHLDQIKIKTEDRGSIQNDHEPDERSIYDDKAVSVAQSIVFEPDKNASDSSHTTGKQSNGEYPTEIHKQQIRARIQIAVRDIDQNASLHLVEECCCLDFLSGDRKFNKATAFYTACLKRYNRTTDLIHISLLRQCILANQGSPVDPYVWSVLQETLQFYTNLAKRPMVENIKVNQALRVLSRLHEVVTYERLGLQFSGYKPWFYGDWCDWIRDTNDKKDSSMPYVLNVGPSRIYPGFLGGYYQAPLPSFLGVRKEDSFRFHEVLQLCGNVLLKICTYLKASFQETYIVDTSGTVQFQLMDSILDRLNDTIASSLQEQYLQSDIVHRYETGDVFTAIGVIEFRVLFWAIALMVTMDVKFSLESRPSGLLPEAVVVNAVWKVAESLISSGPGQRVSREMRTSRIPCELLRFVWGCDIDLSGFSPEELHYGRCSQAEAGLWEFLGEDVLKYDKKRNWVEKQLFIRQTRKIQMRTGGIVTDDMSVISSSTDSSFRRFRAFARSIESRLNSPSQHTLSSGRMSLDSWRLSFITEFDDEQAHRTNAGEVSQRAPRLSRLEAAIAGTIEGLPLPDIARIDWDL